MRFCDLFIEYQIGLKSIKSTIPFTQLPLHRKIAIILVFALAIFSSILFMFRLRIIGCIALAIEIIFIATFKVIDSRKKNLEHMLTKHYSPYSEKRMKMLFRILKKYGIDGNNSASIDLLIDEAQKAQVQCDYLAPLEKPFKTLSAIIFPIGIYVAKKIGDATTPDELLTIFIRLTIIILLVFALVLSISTVVKDICYRDYKKYDELIYDLRQVKLFGCGEKETPST